LGADFSTAVVVVFAYMLRCRADPLKTVRSPTGMLVVIAVDGRPML